MNLRTLARGKPCMCRFPGICNGNPETTVLAHLKRGGWCGSVKPPDVCGVWACSSCHDAIDGRVKVDRKLLDADILGALCRQLVEYVKLGVVKW